MNGTHVNDGVPIAVLSTGAEAAYGAPDTAKVQQAVRDQLLLRSTEPYLKVQAAVQHGTGGAPEAIIATMLRAYTYTADVAKINVAGDYSVRSVGAYTVADDATYENIVAPATVTPIRPIPILPRRVDMVFGTPVPEIPTAKAAVEYLYNLATCLGYRAVKLIGPAANLANYRAYLTRGLWGFVNIGHGYTGGIVLADGNLTSTWFAGLAAKALCPEVVYFNSCQVFNAPLQPAIMCGGPRTFVGGKVNLLIGPSEATCQCFWTKALALLEPMGASLAACEKTNYPVVGAHGISGVTGKFLPIPKC